MDISPRRRHAISTILAVFLAVESVSAVAAAAGTSVAAHASAQATAHALPAASPQGLVFAATGAAVTPAQAAPTASPKPVATPAPRATRAPSATPTPTATPVPAPKATPKPKPKPTARFTPRVAPKAVSKTAPKPIAPVAHVGRNHVWIPSLGINRSVSSFACTRSSPPDSYVYRWGCAGTNNVYLLGHAASVFKPLHDAYLNGRLTVGMRVWYADGSGTVHQYSVRWWKLTRPTTSASWAWAPQSVPSMTLQTCMGANSGYRLMVRLVQVGG